MKSIFITLLTLCLSTAAWAELQTQEIDYTVDDVKLKGYLAYDADVEGKRPGVLVVHEWWGHNNYVRKRADMLAKLGYTAFALDMYGDGKLAEHPKQAKAFMMAVLDNMESGKKRFEAALALLQKQDTVDASKIAAIGYCFGGGLVLNMARMGLDIDGVASFHGGLAAKKPAQPGDIKAKIAVFHGQSDKMIPPEQVGAFMEEMMAAGADVTFNGYAGVMHSFTNPDADKFGEKFSMPLKYDAQADEDSWAKLQVFFKRIFE